MPIHIHTLSAGSDICGYSILAVSLFHRGLYTEPGTEVINRGLVEYFDS
jgi:hypothetical protein